jgi:hypothetical protein
MPHITTCSVCGCCYEETSEELANTPVRECVACWNERQNEQAGRQFERSGLSVPSGRLVGEA